MPTLPIPPPLPPSADTALAPASPSTSLARFDPVEERQVREFLQQKHAATTRRAYERAWASWRGWCLRRGAAPLPAEPRELVLFLSSTSWGLSKIEQVVAAIARAHRLAGIDPPPTSHTLVKDALTVIRRQRGTAPKAPKAALALEELRPLVAQIDRATLAGKRDAALVLLGWWSACRRSELVALEVADVVPAPGGLAITIRRSKTDQAGVGAVVGVERKGGALCPVTAIEEWLAAVKITAGPIFRGFTAQGRLRSTALHAGEVARVLKRLARTAGSDPSWVAGHSLRAGHVTEAILQGVSDVQIMATTRHRSVQTLARYHRVADPVKRGSASKIKI